MITAIVIWLVFLLGFSAGLFWAGRSRDKEWIESEIQERNFDPKDKNKVFETTFRKVAIAPKNMKSRIDWRLGIK